MTKAVRYVYETLDETLFFRNYHCKRGLCQICLLRINGKTERGCYAMLKKGQTYLVEPPERYPLIRDLGVDFGTPVKPSTNGEICWVRDGASIEGEYELVPQVDM